MGTPERPRILIVDDEEAILETMAFTFESEYQVLTARDAETGLRLLDANAPVAAVITDQRMPEVTGVEFLAQVCQRHPNTTRIILTGFADMDTIVQAINRGHVYAYVAKPWEPDELKQLVRHAVEHHLLLRQNEQLMEDLRRINRFLEAAMDEIPMGALVVDARDRVRAVNRSAREYLELEKDPLGEPLEDVLAGSRLADLRAVARRSQEQPEAEEEIQEELELAAADCCLRLRVGVRVLRDRKGGTLGRVYLLREISHEPLRWRFESILHELVRADDGLRDRLTRAVEELRALHDETGRPSVRSPEMAALADRIAQTQTALENWLAVDEALQQESYPDARMLVDRMRLAQARWPLPKALPRRVEQLAQRVEAYYESGENPGGPVL